MSDNIETLDEEFSSFYSFTAVQHLLFKSIHKAPT